MHIVFNLMSWFNWIATGPGQYIEFGSGLQLKVCVEQNILNTMLTVVLISYEKYTYFVTIVREGKYNYIGLSR